MRKKELISGLKNIKEIMLHCDGGNYFTKEEITIIDQALKELSNVDEIHEHCNSTNTIVSDGEKVIYLCDKKACDMCPETECKHTFDITHAVNFECFDGIHYFEKEK